MGFPNYTPPFRSTWSSYTPDQLGTTFFPSDAFRKADACKVYDKAGLLKAFRMGHSRIDLSLVGLDLYVFTDLTAEAIDAHFQKTDVNDQALCMFFHPATEGGAVLLRLKGSRKLEKQLNLSRTKRLHELTFKISRTQLQQVLKDGLTFESLLALVTTNEMTITPNKEDVRSAPEPPFDAGSVKEKYPGSYGHYDIEKEAFEKIFDAEQIRQIYYGNWLRDFNQINLAVVVGPPEKKPAPPETPAKKQKRMAKLAAIRPYFTQDKVRDILEILAVKEFIQKPYRAGELKGLKNPQSFNELLDLFEKTYGKMTKNILGIYRPEEHIDNPIGLADDTWAYPWLYYDYEYEYKKYFSKAGKKAIGPFAGNTGKAGDSGVDGDAAKAVYNDAGINAKDPLNPLGIKHYILFDTEVKGRGETPEEQWVTSYYPSAATYLKRELSLAVQYGATQEGFRHLGAAMHTLEDFFAHSNFCEVTLIKLGEKDVFPWVDSVKETNFVWATRTEDPAFQVVKPAYEIADTETGTATVDPLATYIPIVTGRFLTDDTLASIAPKLSDGLFELKFQPYEERVPGERTTTEMLIRAILENHATERSEDADQPEPAPGGIKREDAGKLLKAYDRFLKLQDDLRRFRNNHPLLHRVLQKTGTISAYIGQTLSIIPKIAMHMVMTGMHHDQKDKQNDKVGTMDSNPSHTQIAKDLPTHPLNTYAALLAVHAVRDVGERINAIWRNMQGLAGQQIESENNTPEAIAQELADYVIRTYFVHPCKTKWMDEISRAWMKTHPKEINLSHHPDTLSPEDKKSLYSGGDFKKELEEYFRSMQKK